MCQFKLYNIQTGVGTQLEYRMDHSLPILAICIYVLLFTVKCVEDNSSFLIVWLLLLKKTTFRWKTTVMIYAGLIWIWCDQPYHSWIEYINGASFIFIINPWETRYGGERYYTQVFSKLWIQIEYICTTMVQYIYALLKSP